MLTEVLRSSGETAPSWATDGTFTPADLTALAKLTAASGWKVILGVNLEPQDPARAADEAEHAEAALGAPLAAIEVGNEPNLYPGTDATQYFAAFESYRQAGSKAVPGLAVVGSEDTSGSNAFQKSFVAAAVLSFRQ